MRSCRVWAWCTTTWWIAFDSKCLIGNPDKRFTSYFSPWLKNSYHEGHEDTRRKPRAHEDQVSADCPLTRLQLDKPQPTPTEAPHLPRASTTRAARRTARARDC